MRCKICDEILPQFIWNSQLNDWEPCPKCLEIINDVWETPVVNTDPDVDLFPDEDFT